MAEDRDTLSREDYASAVREAENAVLTHADHQPHHGYTPDAFRHYVRQRALLSALDSLTFASVLDVGCAEGYFMNVVRGRFGASVWGVDLSTTALAKAHQIYGFPVAAAEATRLPFADDSFDLVLSTEVIEHVLDPDLMIAEMRRVSRGTVLVTTPVSQSADEHEPDYELHDEGHINNFDPATVRRLFGPDATYGSFRCNATLAMIVGFGRHLPGGLRDAFYGLDHAVSQRVGSPVHRVKALRNRDWLITVPATGQSGQTGHGEGKLEWRCAACRGELLREHEPELLRCAGCGTAYAVTGEVPDFFKAVDA
jgi:SAM-dependent methyltransferase